MASNLPILYQNALGQFVTEIAKKAWLWFADTRDTSAMKYAADRYALEVEQFALALSPMLDAAQTIHGSDQETMGDLLKFILKRHANWRLGGNVTLWWENKA